VQKRLHHIAAVSFFSFLLLPVFSMLFLQVAQAYLKRTADKRMEKEALLTITVPEATVHWEKPEKEISLNGKMFDIKSYNITNGILTATGFYDEKESAIRGLLLLLPHDKNKNFLLPVFLLLQCFTIALAWLNDLAVYRQSRKLLTVCLLFLPFPLRFIEEHPPQPELPLS
jgi:hypothetical protein